MALITHAHPLGIEGAVLQACAIALALAHDPATPIDRDLFLDGLRDRMATSTYREVLDRLQGYLADGGRADKETVVSQLGNGIQAHRSVPTAIYAFLRSPEAFREVVIYAIGLGGDTDTIASMAGALAGAYLGLDAIPATWRSRTEGVGVLQKLADSLLAQTSGAG